MTRRRPLFRSLVAAALSLIPATLFAINIAVRDAGRCVRNPYRSARLSQKNWQNPTNNAATGPSTAIASINSIGTPSIIGV